MPEEFDEPVDNGPDLNQPDADKDDDSKTRPHASAAAAEQAPLAGAPVRFFTPGSAPVCQPAAMIHVSLSSESEAEESPRHPHPPPSLRAPACAAPSAPLVLLHDAEPQPPTHSPRASACAATRVPLAFCSHPRPRHPTQGPQLVPLRRPHTSSLKGPRGSIALDPSYRPPSTAAAHLSDEGCSSSDRTVEAPEGPSWTSRLDVRPTAISTTSATKRRVPQPPTGPPPAHLLGAQAVPVLKQ